MHTAQERNAVLREILGKQDCEVTFTKVDGSLRTMPCTLMTESLPARDAAKLHETRIYNPNTLSVWCLDKSEWRSFRVANVTHVKVVS